MSRWVTNRTDQELLDDLLEAYTQRKRDKEIPITVIMGSKILSKFAQPVEGSNNKLWSYRGWLLKNMVA
jgi:hypothetical protein